MCYGNVEIKIKKGKKYQNNIAAFSVSVSCDSCINNTHAYLSFFKATSS